MNPFLRQVNQVKSGWLMPMLMLVVASASVQADSTKDTAPSEYVLEVQGQKDQQESIKSKHDNWEQQQQQIKQQVQQESAQKPASAQAEELARRKAYNFAFPKPNLKPLNEKEESKGKEVDSDARAYLLDKVELLLGLLADLVLPSAAEAATYGTQVVDGNLTDWTVNERLNLPLDKPPYLATGTELYAKYVAGAVPVYVFALKLPGVAIGPNTTVWLNTDQNPATGYQIWGAYGGAEYSMNVFTDGIPYLYNAAGTATVLDYSFSADKTALEFAIPASALGLSTPRAIDVLGDINDSVFFPDFYSLGTQYTVPALADVYPVRTDFSKRVGIVYSAVSKNNFYDEKAYSQLFMALQHQAMMAGIAFDLLNESDLTSISKLANYDALIFPYTPNVSSALYPQIRKTLFAAVYKYNIGIITADNWFTNNELNAALPGDSYQMMKQLLGITRDAGAGPVAVDLVATAITHPVMKGYTANEAILSSQNFNAYKATYVSYYSAVPGQTATVLATQNITGVGNKPGVIASTTGGRNVHFGTAGFLADGPLVWQALQWVVYGTQTPVGLKIGRNSNVFVSRNDMDQSQEYGNGFYDDMGNVDIPLYTLLANWKSTYNFVGSYYINIGNTAPTQQTIWSSNPVNALDAKPLYTKYIALGNEIGTHSYTHPQDTNVLTPTQIEFEFNQSMNQIATNLNPTWQGQAIRGAAVPGMPEKLGVGQNILQHVDYLTGAGSGVGTGYPGAIGFLTPADTKVYFSPNMSFDFTLVDFGVPTGTPPVPVRLNAAQATAYWAKEYDQINNHASQPIVHWPWHDYGPTSATTAASGQGYTVAMFQNTIAKAFNSGAEFATLADVAQRIKTFKAAKLTVTQAANQYTATVATNAITAPVGKFSLALNLPTGQKIQKVTNWYAYNDDKVFLPDAGGSFVVQTGTAADNVTRITALPMRARLISLSGDGTALTFSVQGEGTVNLALSQVATKFGVTSDVTADQVTKTGSTASIKLASFGVHNITVKLLPPVTAYRDLNYTGISQVFNKGTYNTAAQFSVVGDNAISSLRITPGYSVKACDNAAGTGLCSTFTADTPSFITLLNMFNNLNDRISYLLIQ